MKMVIKLISIILIIVKYISGSCDWPDALANTVWDDSSKGEITFTIDTLTGWTFTIAGIDYDTWKCHSTTLYQSDNIIVAITTNTFQFFKIQYYGILCLQLTEITPSSYRYYLKSDASGQMDNERVGVSEDANSENWGALCLQNDLYAARRPADSEYRVMIKKDNVAAAKIDCPYTFLGSYDYTHTADGTTSCNSPGDVLSTCFNSQEISFDYSTCNTKVAYSVSESVWCVDTVPSGGDNYVTVYNGNDADAEIDNVDVYRFSCFAISGDGTKASIVPNSCRKDQTPETVPALTGQSNGATLTLTKSTESCLTCPLLTAPDSGTVSYSTNGAVTSASFNCSSEYSLAGPDTRVCQSDDTWSDENPTCTCILPPAPANGSLVASVDGTLTYSCDVGFVINGDRTRTCQSNSNTWSGVEATCEGCDTLASPDGGYFNLSTDGEVTMSTYSCNVGYTMSGEQFSYCLNDGSWNDTAPSCVTCENLVTPENGVYQFSTDGTTTTGQLQCNNGYEASGKTEIYCGSDGEWRYNQQSTCDKVDDRCSLLNVLIGVSVASLVIIATLAIFLTIFVYLYLRQKRNGRYATTNVSFIDKKFEDGFDLKPVKMSKSAAPVNHQHSAFDRSGTFSTSPAPEGFTENGALPESPFRSESSFISFRRSGSSFISIRRSGTTLTNKNYPAVNAISIAEVQQGKTMPTIFSKNTNGHLKPEVLPPEMKVPKLPLNKLSPTPNHKQRIGRLESASPQIKKVIKEFKLESVGRVSPVEGRPQSVMSHALSVASYDSKSLDSISTVAD